MEQKGGLLTLLWRFVRPEMDELFLYVAVAIIIAGVAAYQLAVNGQIGADSMDITSSMHHAFSMTGQYMSQGSGWAKFFLFGFWFIIGGIAYTVVWATITIIVDIRNDIRVSESFIHPRSFRKSDYWLSIVARTAVRAIAGIALLFYTVFWLWIFAPVYVNADERLINNTSDMRNVSDFLLSLIGIVVTLHIAAILIRLALLHPSRDPSDY